MLHKTTYNVTKHTVTIYNTPTEHSTEKEWLAEQNPVWSTPMKTSSTCV